MDITKFTLGEFGTNSYLLIKGKQAILIDVGFKPDEIKQFLYEHEIQLKAILLTHAHLDHIGGLEYIRAAYNVPVYVHSQEKDWLTKPNYNGSEAYPYFGRVVCEPAEHLIEDNIYLEIGDFNLKVIHTPGHTPGSVSYYTAPYLFTGDTLFRRSIGRTDLYGGNHEQLTYSIQSKVFSLPEETIVLPGHGEATLIKEEKINNPYV